MNKYKVYFQFNGKKMAMEVEADDRYDAENIVYDKLKIDAVKLIEGSEPSKESNNMFDGDSMDFLKGMFKMK